MQVEQYEYLPGMPELLGTLKQQGYEMHVVSNYPAWYRMIEDKLQVPVYRLCCLYSCSTCALDRFCGLILHLLKRFDSLACAASERTAVDDMETLLHVDLYLYSWDVFGLQCERRSGVQLSQYMPWTFISCEGPMKVRCPAVACCC